MRPYPTRLPERGEIVADRYQVVEQIGRGGQSVVFRARDLRHGDEIALKVLQKGQNKDPNAVERMFREAYAMATLSGTAALRVMDQVWTAAGDLCLVTELIHGKELNQWLALIEKQDVKLFPRQLVELLHPIVFTLSAAHHKGIIHRDVKPQNIFIVDPDHGGGVRLIDFGFAKFVRMRGFTEKHIVAGSPSYIAPEAWEGKRELYDQRLDVYALGAVLFRCLAGRPPFKCNGLPALYRAVTQSPRPSLHSYRPDLPKKLDPWVESALAISPEERFHTVEALWNAFQTASKCRTKNA